MDGATMLTCLQASPASSGTHCHSRQGHHAPTQPPPPPPSACPTSTRKQRPGLHCAQLSPASFLHPELQGLHQQGAPATPLHGSAQLHSLCRTGSTDHTSALGWAPRLLRQDVSSLARAAQTDPPCRPLPHLAPAPPPTPSCDPRPALLVAAHLLSSPSSAWLQMRILPPRCPPPKMGHLHVPAASVSGRAAVLLLRPNPPLAPDSAPCLPPPVALQPRGHLSNEGRVSGNRCQRFFSNAQKVFSQKSSLSS